MKIIPHAFGERPVLKLMYAAVIRAADRWRADHGWRVRAAATARDSRGAQSRSRRARGASNESFSFPPMRGTLWTLGPASRCAARQMSRYHGIVNTTSTQ